MSLRMRSRAVVMLAVLLVVEFGFCGLAEAKRLGGGKTFGTKPAEPVLKSNTAPTPPAANAAPLASQPAPGLVPARPARTGMWGMLGGLALGVGLGALLSQFGVGAEFGGMLMVILLVVGGILLFKLLFRRPQSPPLRYAAAGAPIEAAPLLHANETAGGSAVQVPPGFDSEGFIRQAKLNFIRLQAANDAGNLEDIRQFTSPEVFAELQLQYEERGRVQQHTDVVELGADLLHAGSEPTRYLASVRFHGRIRESADAQVESINEVWHLTKPLDGSSGWVLAGVQQVD